MNAAQTKAAGPGGVAAFNTTDKSNFTGVDRSGKRLPAYAGDLIKLQRTGRTVPYLLIGIGWDAAGKAMPRVVVPADLDTSELDLHFVRGLDCMVVHRDESVRAFDVAETALTAGANRCPVFDMAARGLEATTDDVLAVRGVRMAA